MKTMKFTKEELSVITARYNEIHQSVQESNSLKENLVSYYMSSNPSLNKADAETEVSGLMSGVKDLTGKFNAAMEEGWNPAGHIAEMVRDMDLQKRYDFLVTAISVVNTLNVQTLGDVHDVETSVNEAIEELKSGNVEVTENVCDQLQDTLSGMLETSPLMLANSDQVREMMDAASMGTVNAVDFTSVHYEDFRHKNVMALATWIEYKNGNLPSLPDNMLPEIMGVSIAAGVEEARIMEEVATGSKTLEWAIKCLEVLGAIAITCFLGYIALLGMGLLLGAFFEAAIFVMGTSTLAMIVATALAFLVCWGYTDVVIKTVTRVLEWSGKAYDYVMTKFKEHVFPAIKRCYVKLVAWIKSLFGKGGDSSAFQEAAV